MQAFKSTSTLEPAPTNFLPFINITLSSPLLYCLHEGGGEEDK
jgi:hypothetical protein